MSVCTGKTYTILVDIYPCSISCSIVILEVFYSHVLLEMHLCKRTWMNRYRAADDVIYCYYYYFLEGVVQETVLRKE